MDLIFSASIIASFFAGMVALFAPCCVGVLLPAYMASAFREKRQILKMTFVFFAGISTVLLPIGLGAAGLAQVFRNFHRELYLVGGLLMLVFAVMAVKGKGFHFLPKSMSPKNINPSDKKSVFVLGMFSGAATSCCAPVLAGAVTLAAISGVFWKALVVVFAYIFGITFPLFIAGYLYDRFHIENSRIIKGRLLEFKFGQKTIYVHSTNLLAGAVFALMGIMLLILAVSGNAFWAPELQVKIGTALNKWSQIIINKLMIVPNLVWGLTIIGLFVFLIYKSIKTDQRDL